MKKQLNLITVLFVMIILTGVTDIIYSQSVNRNNSFVAIFKDTLLESTEKTEMEICTNIADTEIRIIISKDSLISLNSIKDSIWTFDFTINGRRCYGTVFGGNTLKGVMKENFSDNLIYLYSTSDIHISRLISGLIIYNSEEAPWKFRAKTE